MSALPSPLKSPTFTSTQVAPVLQVSHTDMVKALPLDKPTHQLPVFASRAAMSARPSPLKSPVSTSTQVIVGSQVPNKLLVKALEPLERLTHHCPDWLALPTRSSGRRERPPATDAVELMVAAATLPGSLICTVMGKSPCSE